MGIERTMKAAILVEQKKPLMLKHITLPARLRFGQVLVKVFFSGICGSQIGEIDGVKGDDHFLPHLLGHEGSGEVIAIGDGVTNVNAGDYVVMHWRKGIGIDAPVPQYESNGEIINAGFVTTFNEYAVVSENRVTQIPKDFPMDIAPLFGCAVTTGLGVVNNNAELKIGESVIVFGAGGVGLNVIQGAAMVTAYPIIAVDIYDKRLKMAKKFGATHLINSTKQNVQEEVQQILKGSMADVVIDNTGNTDVINLGYELTAPQGRTILVGVPPKGNNISLYSLPLHFNKTITGSHGGETNPSVDIPRYIKLYKKGQLELNQLITDRFTLDEINTAIVGMRNGDIAGRCLIDMETVST